MKQAMSAPAPFIPSHCPSSTDSTHYLLLLLLFLLLLLILSPYPSRQLNLPSIQLEKNYPSIVPRSRLGTMNHHITARDVYRRYWSGDSDYFTKMFSSVLGRTRTRTSAVCILCRKTKIAFFSLGLWKGWGWYKTPPFFLPNSSFFSLLLPYLPRCVSRSLPART